MHPVTPSKIPYGLDYLRILIEAYCFDVPSPLKTPWEKEAAENLLFYQLIAKGRGDTFAATREGSDKVKELMGPTYLTEEERTKILPLFNSLLFNGTPEKIGQFLQQAKLSHPAPRAGTQITPIGMEVLRRLFDTEITRNTEPHLLPVVRLQIRNYPTQRKSIPEVPDIPENVFTPDDLPGTKQFKLKVQQNPAGALLHIGHILNGHDLRYLSDKHPDAMIRYGYDRMSSYVRDHCIRSCPELALQNQDKLKLRESEINLCYSKIAGVIDRPLKLSFEWIHWMLYHHPIYRRALTDGLKWQFYSEFRGFNDVLSELWPFLENDLRALVYGKVEEELLFQDAA